MWFGSCCLCTECEWRRMQWWAAAEFTERWEFPSTSLRHNVSFYSQRLGLCPYQHSNNERTYWTFQSCSEVLCHVLVTGSQKHKSAQAFRREKKVTFQICGSVSVSFIADVYCRNVLDFSLSSVRYIFFKHILKYWRGIFTIFFCFKDPKRNCF